MASMSNFTVYLDECIDSDKLIALMKREGWTVISPRNVGTLGRSDADHLEFCAQHGYSLLTAAPDDFLDLHYQWQAQGRQHAGILAVYAERDLSKNMSDHDIFRAIKKLLASGAPIANQFIVLNHWQ